MASVSDTFLSLVSGHVEELGGGKYLWLGTFESVRVGWTMKLNIDMANKPAYKKSKFPHYYYATYICRYRLDLACNMARGLTKFF